MNNETNTVTISIEEYFDLRQKAEMNMTMVRELAHFESRMNEFSDRLYGFERMVSDLRREVKK